MKTSEAAAPYVQRLQLSEGYELLYAIAVGYPDEAPDAKPRDAAKVKFVE
jgi:nitroreductase